MKYKYLLFDADGTLFDFNRAEKDELLRAFKGIELSCEDTTYNLYSEINENLWKEYELGLVRTSLPTIDLINQVRQHPAQQL